MRYTELRMDRPQPGCFAYNLIVITLMLLTVGSIVIVLVVQPATALNLEVARSVAFWTVLLVPLFLLVFLSSLAVILRQRRQQHQLLLGYQRLEQVAYVDPLTGIHNQRFFQEALERQVAEKQPFTVILVDINHFRYYNVGCGLAAGDRLLKQVVMIVSGLAPPESIVSRYGADQIAVMLPGGDEGTILSLAQRIQEAIRTYPFPGKKSQLGGEIRTSTGIIHFPRDGVNGEELIRSLEQALHDPQDTSGNIKVYVSALQGLRSSLEKSELQLFTGIHTLLGIIHAKDQYTMAHTERVVDLSTALAEFLGLPEEDIKTISYGAYLHDIGKIEIDYAILNKEGTLTDEERARIKQHPVVGAEIIRPIETLKNVIPIILHHHEYFDGSGYPVGLTGEEIPFHARIVAIMDSYDAMTTRRSYREPMSRPEALREIKKCAGTQFDPRLVDVFLESGLGREVAV